MRTLHIGIIAHLDIANPLRLREPIKKWFRQICADHKPAKSFAIACPDSKPAARPWNALRIAACTVSDFTIFAVGVPALLAHVVHKPR